MNMPQVLIEHLILFSSLTVLCIATKMKGAKLFPLHLIHSTAKSLLAKLEFSIRHYLEVIAVSIMFACLRSRPKHLKENIS